MTLVLIPYFTNSAAKTCNLNVKFGNPYSFRVFKLPEYLTSKFVTRNESNYALRVSVKKLVVPFLRTSYMKTSFSYSGATLWNSLPWNIRESASLNQFKSLLYHTF